NPLQQISTLGTTDLFQSCRQGVQSQAVAVLIELRLLSKDRGLGQAVGVAAGGCAIIVRCRGGEVITFYGRAAAGQTWLTAKNGRQRRARTGQGIQLPAGGPQMGIQVVWLCSAFKDTQANDVCTVAGTNLYGLGAPKGHDCRIHGTVVSIGLIAGNILQMDLFAGQAAQGLQLNQQGRGALRMRPNIKLFVVITGTGPGSFLMLGGRLPFIALIGGAKRSSNFLIRWKRSLVCRYGRSPTCIQQSSALLSLLGLYRQHTQKIAHMHTGHDTRHLQGGLLVYGL